MKSIYDTWIIYRNSFQKFTYDIAPTKAEYLPHYNKVIPVIIDDRVVISGYSLIEYLYLNETLVKPFEKKAGAIRRAKISHLRYKSTEVTYK